MAANDVKVLVDLSVRGRELVKGASSDLAQLDTTAKRASMGMGDLARGFATGTAVIAGAAIAAKQLYDVLRAGAVLQTTSQRFDKLSASIGTTADMMLGNLRTATKGMISDMELMASASQIMSLKLADNEDQVIRLATVAGTLGWDMQQVILTFANLSTMRLDALGLSVEEVKTKAAELEAAGMSAQEAFKEAVILAGEARLDIGGVSESEQAFKQLEAAIANTKNELVLMSVELAKSVGLIDAMGNFAGTMNLRSQLIDLKDAGKITGEEFDRLFVMLRYGGPEAVQAALDSMGKLKPGLEGIDNALLSNENAWAAWASGIQVSANEATIAARRAATEIFRAMIGTTNTSWFGGMGEGAPPSPLMPAGQKMASVFPPGFAAQSDQALAMWGEVVTGATEATAATYGYAAAVDETALAHSRMVQAFNAEAGAKIEDGLIGADGLVNIEAANKALYEQAQAAGASAGELALLGIATGQLTDEQAKAALKAAILMERIKQLAAAVTSGDLSIGDAMGGLGDFRAQLDSGALSGAAGGIEGLAAAAEGFANGEYVATFDVENVQAMGAISDLQAGVNDLTGNHVIHFTTTYDLPTGGTGSNRAGAPISVNNTGGVSSDTTSGRSGGSVYNVTVTNYVDGKQASHGSLDDITADKMAAALRGLGMGGR